MCSFVSCRCDETAGFIALISSVDIVLLNSPDTCKLHTNASLKYVLLAALDQGLSFSLSLLFGWRAHLETTLTLKKMVHSHTKEQECFTERSMLLGHWELESREQQQNKQWMQQKRLQKNNTNKYVMYLFSLKTFQIKCVGVLWEVVGS